MSFSYTPTLPTPKDQVRLRLQDTAQASAVFQDEEINAMIAMYSYDEACAQLAESASMNFARQAEVVDNGPIKYIFRDRAQFYLDLAKSIRSMAQPPPWAPSWTGATGGQMVEPNLRNYRTD